MLSDRNAMKSLTPVDRVERRIYLIRGQRVMLDCDLAEIYGVSTKKLNQAVKRNESRFPNNFMFQLAPREVESLRSQIVTSKKGRGGRRYRPYVFSEYGAVMLSAVLHTPIAVEASIQIALAFVRLREMVSTHKELAHKLSELERKVESHDGHIRSLFDAIRQLMEPPEKPRRRIGFAP